MSAATPQPSACTSPSTEPVAWLHDAGPLFDKLELDDVRLHCRYMGLANFADSLDDRLHAIAVAKGTALPVALVAWQADTVKKVQRLRQEVRKLEAKAGQLSVDLHEQPDSFSRGAGIRPAAPILNEELRYVKVHLELDGLRSLAAKQVQISLAADSSMSAAISNAARNTQRLEQLQKQFDRLQSTLGSEFKPGTPDFCSAAEELCDRQVHALQLQISDAVADIRCLQQLRAEHGDSDKSSRGMQQKIKLKRKVAKQRIGQLQGWLKHDYSSQAGGEALSADAILQGNLPWDVSSGGSFRELLWFQHHMAAGKLARCNEQLLLLKLQAANALHLFSHQEQFGQYWALTAERLAQRLRHGHPQQAAVVEGIRYLLHQRLKSLECQHKAAREAFSKVDLL